MDVRRSVPLSGYTTLGVGGPARYLVEVLSEEDVVRACGVASDEGLPLEVLGGGSNILVSDEGFPGVVLLMRIRGLSEAVECAASSASGGAGPVRAGREAAAVVEVSAGEEWDGFVARMVERGLGGVECMSGIPGTVGATPIQNVGAYGQEAASVIDRVRVFDREAGRFVDIHGGDCGFEYRGSMFAGAGAGRFIVTRVAFLLRPGVAPTIAYEDIVRTLGARRDSATLADVREAVLEVRRGKGMLMGHDGIEQRTAGSFFKNPTVAREESERLRSAAGPAALAHSAPDGRVKIAAARLIELAGFHKGERRGNVAISSRHALALVSLEGASAREIREFAREIRDRVRDRFGIILQPEPVMLGFDDPF